MSKEGHVIHKMIQHHKLAKYFFRSTIEFAYQQIDWKLSSSHLYNHMAY